MMNYLIIDKIIKEALIEDVPNEDIKNGDIGAIVMTYKEPNEAYEVEFINEDGSQKAQIVFQPNEIEKY